LLIQTHLPTQALQRQRQQVASPRRQTTGTFTQTALLLIGLEDPMLFQPTPPWLHCVLRR
jgi:hypothetical protein